MAERKTPDPSSAQPPSEAAANTPASDDQNQLLREIRNLAASVKQLAERPAYEPPSKPQPPPPDPGAAKQRTARFGYSLLGELIGRRRKPGSGEPEFKTPRVDAIRDDTGIAFIGDLRGATFAQVYAADETKDHGEISKARVELRNIPSTIPIEFIVLYVAEGGEPVAIGPSLPALKLPVIT